MKNIKCILMLFIFIGAFTVAMNITDDTIVNASVTQGVINKLKAQEKSNKKYAIKTSNNCKKSIKKERKNIKKIKIQIKKYKKLDNYQFYNNITLLNKIKNKEKEIDILYDKIYYYDSFNKTNRLNELYILEEDKLNKIYALDDIKSKYKLYSIEYNETEKQQDKLWEEYLKIWDEIKYYDKNDKIIGYDTLVYNINKQINAKYKDLDKLEYERNKYEKYINKYTKKLKKANINILRDKCYIQLLKYDIYYPLTGYKNLWADHFDYFQYVKKDKEFFWFTGWDYNNGNYYENLPVYSL